MGYFPLPELKGKPNRIFVDGKTLNQIAKESGIRLDTVQHRYSRGIRDYEGLTKPSHKVYDEEDKKERTLEECVTPLEVGSVRRVQVKKGDTREVHHFRVLEELKA